ncbi:hypothetical protein ROLI_017610 [Roseobacter fucihabitans]|uniref:High-affinity zinc uptake system protein ZnuA n=1 Tax=Roseobacter fucihabitans TaxID=1537242 RepID=A0ABZ2BRS1_9RHOB|nr:zinc ABC transporter substrate-binding protein [Roseobacter litoralis]MBC6964364.1 High-affinity zinc uptake system protein ZnuA precursor [Roseobacter litoralis]
MRVFSLLLAATCLSGPVFAQTPRVASDIAPVHGLVSRVMAGVGVPDLILPPGASPHSYAMRPSEARALAQADMVVLVGPALTPWLSGSLEALAPDAVRLEWMQSATLLPFREGALFDGHDHAHGSEADGHEDHDAHDDHDAHEDEHHAADEHQTHDDHAAKHEDHDAHGHEDHATQGHEDHDAKDHAEHAPKGDDEHHAEDHAAQWDPHVWLDPANGSAFLMRIAQELGALDPKNAETYLSNARAGQAELAALTDRIASEMTAVQGRPFVVFHDAYHYFEARFDVEAVASINQADDSAASAGRLAEVRDAAQTANIACFFTEPQAPEGLVEAVAGREGARIGIIDPIGAEIALGADFYPALMTQIATSFSECLSEDAQK